MKHWLMASALICLCSKVDAAYFRFMDVHAIQQSASLSIDPNGVARNSMITDIAIITHSTVDGTIMPASCRTTWCQPENHAFTIGGGGNLGFTNGKLRGNSVVDAGWSVNVAPQLGGIILAGVGSSSAPWLQAVKAQMLNVGGNGVRLGYSLEGNLVDNGTFTFKQILPGQGFGQIVKNASRIKVGYSWTWK